MVSQNGMCRYSDNGCIAAPAARASSELTNCSEANLSVKRSAVGYEVYRGPKPSYLRISSGSNDTGATESMDVACEFAIQPLCRRAPTPALSQINSRYGYGCAPRECWRPSPRMRYGSFASVKDPGSSLGSI